MADSTTEEQDLKARQAAALASQTKNSPVDGTPEGEGSAEKPQETAPTQGTSEPTAPSADGAEDQSTPAQGETQSAPSAQTAQGTQDPNQGQPAQSQASPEKMIPQSQVDKLVGKARQEGRESALKALYDKYGVDTPEALDELFGNGQRYDGLNDQFSEQENNLKQLQSENALLISNIDKSRWDDVKARLAFDQLDVTPENIQMELATHPEWVGSAQAAQPQTQQQPLTPQMGEQAVAQSQARAQNAPTPTPSTITRLGAEPGRAPEVDEETKAMHLYGLDK
jgi:hypothetical protein